MIDFSYCHKYVCTTYGNTKIVLGPVFYNSFQDPVDACPGVTGNITQYQISFQTGSVVATENVDIAKCTAGRCSHTFEPPSNPPSSYDSVSVAAVNVVGVGAARTCTTQAIGKFKNLEHVLQQQNEGYLFVVCGMSKPKHFLSSDTGSCIAF